MKKQKKIITSALFLFLSVGMISGCSLKKHETDILTMTIGYSVNMVDASGMLNFEKALKEEFPDIDFHIQYYTGTNTGAYSRKMLINGDSGDIFITCSDILPENQKKYLLDLSGYGFTSNYDISVLNRLTVDGSLYMLPTPHSLRFMAYNKTMFQENGWEKPNNHEELTALCEKIRKSSDVIPIGFVGSDMSCYFSMMSTLAQCDYLQTADGAQWEQDFIAGNAKARQGLQGGISLMQDLVDAKAFDVDAVKQDRSGDCIDKLVNRKSAMAMIFNKQKEFFQKTGKAEDEFGIFPFYGIEEDSAVLGRNDEYRFGLSNRLGEKENKKKLENALKVMEWISAKETQDLLKDSGYDLSPIKSGDSAQDLGVYEEVKDVYKQGKVLSFLYRGFEDMIIPAGETLKKEMEEEGDLSRVFAVMDGLNYEELISYGEVGERLTTEQTAQFLADVFYSTQKADIAMISMGDKKGNVMNNIGAHGRLYEGKVTVDELDMNLPCADENISPDNLYTLHLSGEQIKTMMEQGKEVKETNEGEVSEKEETAVFQYYWSGMKKEELEDEKVYTVIAAQGDYTESIEKAGNPEDTGINIKELYEKYVKENSPIKAPEVLR